MKDSDSVSNDRTTRISRRKFVVVGGVAVGVVVGGTLYYLSPALRNLVNSLLNIGGQGTTTTTAIIGPTTIEDLQWNPTRTVNSKVYDGKVSFAVDNSDPSNDQITLDFGSIYPVGMPQTAFTSEADRTYAFTSSGKRQTFSQDIANLVGGRQYRALVTVKDKNGKETVNYADTPYVREFENIAKDAGINIGAYYYPWYPKSTLSYQGTPLLGYYNSQDQFVISKHIDWSSGYGIGYWLSSWFGPLDYRNQVLFSNNLIDDVRIGITYESVDRLRDDITPEGYDSFNMNDKSNVDVLVNDFRSLAQNYFGLPQYWKIDNKPVVFLYLSRAYIGDISHALGLARSAVQEYGFDPFIIGDEVFWDSPSQTPSSRLRSFDAITAYNLHSQPHYGVTDSNYESRIDSLFRAWSSKANAAGTRFIPLATPGFRIINSPERTLTRDVSRFEKRLKIAKKFVDSKIKVMMITTFNEWFENTFVEPSTNEKFDYLQATRGAISS